MNPYIKIFFLIIPSIVQCHCLLVFTDYNEMVYKTPIENRGNLQKFIECEFKVTYNVKYGNDSLNKGMFVRTTTTDYLDSISKAFELRKNLHLRKPDEKSKADYYCNIAIYQNSVISIKAIAQIMIASLTVLVYPAVRPMKDSISVEVFDRDRILIFKKEQILSYDVYASIFVVLHYWFGYEKRTNEFYYQALNGIFNEFEINQK